jgi:hypothetical protein
MCIKKQKQSEVSEPSVTESLKAKIAQMERRFNETLEKKQVQMKTLETSIQTLRKANENLASNFELLKLCLEASNRNTDDWKKQYEELQVMYDLLTANPWEGKVKLHSPCLNCSIKKTCDVLKLYKKPLDKCMNPLERPKHDDRDFMQEQINKARKGPVFISDDRGFPMDAVEFWNKGFLSN